MYIIPITSMEVVQQYTKNGSAAVKIVCPSIFTINTSVAEAVEQQIVFQLISFQTSSI